MNTATNALRTLAVMYCLLTLGCKGGSGDVLVTFVDANGASANDRSAVPLLLVVEINSDGKLSLNRIGTGSVADTTVLREKLQAVFEDREKASINERDVVIEMNGTIKREDLDVLISALANARAASIRVTSKGSN